MDYEKKESLKAARNEENQFSICATGIIIEFEL